MFGQSALGFMVFILWHGGGSSGEISAQMALLVLVTSRAVPGAIRFISEASGMQAAVPSVQAILQLKNVDTAQGEGAAENDADLRPPSDTWRYIRLKEISYCYPNMDEMALENISLEIRRGGAFGVAGKSGAGKSTVIDILVGLLSPVKGSIESGEKEAVRLTSPRWRAQIGFVPQEPYIADASLRANVAFGVPTNEVDDTHVKKCLAKAGLEKFFAELTDGLETGLGDQGERMSGGQKQRVAIARALYQKPSILVLDEATSALDTENERVIQEALQNLQGELTVVIIAHRHTTLRHCDTIFLLESGKLVAQGSHAELMKSNTRFQLLAGEHQSL